MCGNQRGQTLLELIVVISISVIVVGALVFATISSLRNASFSKNQAQATKLAQEGIERVRSGRDRNQPITLLPYLHTNVSSWSGDDAGDQSIWEYKINGDCGHTTPTPPTLPTYCYFKVSDTGALNNFAVGSSIPAGADLSVPPFKRAIIISDDDATYRVRKTVTAVVSWEDFSGPHESRLTTILRKL